MRLPQCKGENLLAANSRIRDADIARQMMEYTMTSVLQRAQQSMLSHRLLQAQGVLQMLR